MTDDKNVEIQMFMIKSAMDLYNVMSKTFERYYSCFSGV